MMKKEPVIAIKNLNHYYGRGALKRQILFDINLEIYPGEIVIMTGPSGSGKTTLLSLIGGLRSVQEGSLKFLGSELMGASQNQLVQVRRKIGYIFQAHNLLGFLTARQNVQMAVELNNEIIQSEAIAKSEAMLTAVGLEQRINYYPDNLSGGQKQRIAIARALVNHPPLVLADEPTAALDKQSGRDVVEIMQRLAKDQGTSILLVTHDNRILDIADRIVEMEDGLLTRDAQGMAKNHNS
jgi:putative ABC transport system ATP-binding protein